MEYKITYRHPFAKSWQLREVFKCNSKRQFYQELSRLVHSHECEICIFVDGILTNRISHFSPRTIEEV